MGMMLMGSWRDEDRGMMMMVMIDKIHFVDLRKWKLFTCFYIFLPISIVLINYIDIRTETIVLFKNKNTKQSNIHKD